MNKSMHAREPAAFCGEVLWTEDAIYVKFC